MIFYIISSETTNTPYSYFLFLNSDFIIQRAFFSTTISDSEYLRMCQNFFNKLDSKNSTKHILYFYPKTFMVKRKSVYWSQLLQGFEKIEPLSDQNTPGFNLILNRIDKAYKNTLQEIPTLERFESGQKTEQLKKLFLKYYENFQIETEQVNDVLIQDTNAKHFENQIPTETLTKENSTKETLTTENLTTENLTKETFSQKIKELESLVQNKGNITKTQRNLFQKLIKKCKEKIDLFTEFEENQIYLLNLFNELNQFELMIIRSTNLLKTPVYLRKVRNIISQKTVTILIEFAGYSFLQKQNEKLYTFQRLRLQLIYWLLFNSGLRAKDTACLTFEMIHDLLQGQEIILNNQKTRIVLNDFTTNQFSLLDIQDSLDSFFNQQGVKYLGSTLYKKDQIGNLDDYLKHINNDLNYICHQMQWEPLTTQDFRYTFIKNQLKYDSFENIENKYEYLNRINKRTYF